MKFLKSLPKDKLQKLILVVIVSLVAIGAVFNFFVLKQISTISVKGEEIQTLNKQLADARQAVKDEVTNTILRNQIREFLTVQEQRMVDGDAFSWIVREMALFAEKQTAHIVAVIPGGKTPYQPKPQYSVFSTRLEVTGTYDQLGRFVSDLENTYPTCVIRNLGMAMADASRGECRINLEMTLLMHTSTESDKPSAGKAETGKQKKA